MEAAGICAATVAAGFRVFVVVAGFVAGAAVLLVAGEQHRLVVAEGAGAPGPASAERAAAPGPASGSAGPAVGCTVAPSWDYSCWELVGA